MGASRRTWKPPPTCGASGASSPLGRRTRADALGQVRRNHEAGRRCVESADALGTEHHKPSLESGPNATSDLAGRGRDQAGTHRSDLRACAREGLSAPESVRLGGRVNAKRLATLDWLAQRAATAAERELAARTAADARARSRRWRPHCSVDGCHRRAASTGTLCRLCRKQQECS